MLLKGLLDPPQPPQKAFPSVSRMEVKAEIDRSNSTIHTGSRKGQSRLYGEKCKILLKHMEEEL